MTRRPTIIDVAKGAERLRFIGARSIALGGVERRPITLRRISGYPAIMEERGHEPLATVGRSSRAFGRDAAVLLSRDWAVVDAAIRFNDLVAMGMLSKLLAEGRHAGRDDRVAGFDDLEECLMAYSPLSSARRDIMGFGRRRAATLLAWLKEGQRPAHESRAPVSLVMRASSLGA